MALDLGPRMDERDKTIQADRILVGLCPRCDAPTAVVNWHECWPLVHCACGWAGATTELHQRHRVEAPRVVHEDPIADAVRALLPELGA